jgi:hypothetical protein
VYSNEYKFGFILVLYIILWDYGQIEMSRSGIEAEDLLNLTVMIFTYKIVYDVFHQED